MLRAPLDAFSSKRVPILRCEKTDLAMLGERLFWILSLVFYGGPPSPGAEAQAPLPCGQDQPHH